MSNEQIINTFNATPQIYCAVVMSFDKALDLAPIIQSLEQLEIEEYEVNTPIFGESNSISIAIIRNERCWELDAVLRKMFSKIDGRENALKTLVERFGGDFHIDISFYHDEIYPALIFSKDVLQKINMFGASIGIDPY